MAGLEKIVTDELVFEIADRLVVEGKSVTHRVIYDEIKQVCGQGGSMTTIAAALRRWKEAQAIKSAQPVERPPLPSAIHEVMLDTVGLLWRAAQIETQAEVDATTIAADARVAEAQAANEDVLVELQVALDEAGVLKEQTTQQGVSLAEVRQSLLDAQLAVSIEKARADATAATADERAARIEDMKTELQTVRAEQERERREFLQQTEQAANTAKLLAGAEASAHEMEKQIADLHEQRKLAVQEVNWAAEKIAKIEADRDECRREIKLAAVENAKLTGKIETLQVQLTGQAK